MLKIVMIASVCLACLSSVTEAARYPRANSPAYYGFSNDYAQPARPRYNLIPKASYPQPSYGQPSYGAAAYEPAYESKPSPYSFGYKVNDGYGNSNFQNEEGDDYGTKKGSYGYTDAYGIYRKVDYIADAHGFRANVYTNEPGTAPQAPADTKWVSKAPEPSVAYAASAYPPSTYVAPVEAYKMPSAAYYAPTRNYGSRY